MTTRSLRARTGRACETCRKLAAPLALALLLVIPTAPSAAAAAPPGPAAPQEHGPEHAGEAVAEHAPDEHHAESPWTFIGRVFNFTLLAGTLLFLLRKPIADYLSNRGTQVREDLVTAARMKEEASRQIATIEARLQELPRELDALRARGRDEIAAEEARIEEAAAAERERLLEGTRREIDLQLRLARRDLVSHAADLAVQVARERIRTHITDQDQRRLVDRYMAQVRTHA